MTHAFHLFIERGERKRDRSGIPFAEEWTLFLKVSK